MYSQITPNDSLVDSILYTLLQRKSARGYWSNTNVTAQMLDGVKTYIKARNLETVDFNTNVLRVKTVIDTHCHVDHIAGNKYFFDN